jgi:hypothetical protein
MEEAIRTALETEAFLAAEKQKHPTKYARAVESSQGDDQMNKMLSLLETLVEKQNTKKDQQTESQGIDSTTNQRRSSGRGRSNRGRFGRGAGSQGNRGCFKCGAPDHFIASCPYWNHPGNEIRPDQGVRDGSEVTISAPIRQ